MKKDNKSISYTAVVLDDDSREKLIGMFNTPEGWEVLCHHMTINMGPAKEPVAEMVGRTASLIVDSVAIDYEIGVIAAGVITEVPSKNDVKHITVAVNRASGAKPFHSNKLKNWVPVKEVELSGKIMEVPQ